MPLTDEFHELARKVNNWGRWGDDDELGTLNLLTPDVVRRAAELVRRGQVFSLALPLGPDGPQIGMIRAGSTRCAPCWSSTGPPSTPKASAPATTWW